MPAGQFAPSRLHLDYPEWTPPQVGDTGKPWVWNNATQKYEQVSGVTFTSGVVTLATALASPAWRPASDSTTALKIQNAAGTMDVAVANTTDGYFCANTLLVNTSSPNDNTLPYKMVVAVPGGLNDNGGVMITSNQNVNAYKALLSLVNYNNTVTGGYAKTTFMASGYQAASVSSTQNPDGAFVNLSYLKVPNLTTITQNLYVQTSNADPNVSTSGENINSQSYFYVQGSAGQQTKINSAVGFRSRGQLVVTNTVVTTMTDFHAAPFVGAANGAITTRYGVLINFDNTNVTNAYGVYQSSSTVKNFFGGNVGIGTIPTYLLHVEVSQAGTASEQNSVYVNSQINSGNNTYNSIDRGFQGVMVCPTVASSAGATNFNGIYVRPQVNGSGAITNVNGIQIYTGYSYAGNTNNVTSAKGVWIKNWGNAAPQTFTNQYGLYIDNIVGATNNYAIYSAGGANFFAGPIVASIIRPLIDSTTAIKIQKAAGTRDFVVVNTVSGNTILTSDTDEVLSLKSSLTTSTQWKFWHGTPGNYEGYLKIGTGTDVNAWELALLPSNGGGSFRNSVSSPKYKSLITGRGDSEIVQWVNTGGDFNGTLKLGQQYASGTFGVTTYIGQVSGSDFKISNNLEATLFGVDYQGKIKTNQAITNTNAPSGATVKALPVYNEAGTLLGYVPIYASQW